MKKIKNWLTSTYDFDRTEVTKYDYVFLGACAGVAIVALKSSLLAILVFGALAHFSWKRK